MHRTRASISPEAWKAYFQSHVEVLPPPCALPAVNTPLARLTECCMQRQPPLEKRMLQKPQEQNEKTESQLQQKNAAREAEGKRQKTQT